MKWGEVTEAMKAEMVRRREAKESLMSIALDMDCSAPTVARHTRHLGKEYFAPVSRPKFDVEKFYARCCEGASRAELMREFNLSRSGVGKARRRLRDQGRDFVSNPPSISVSRSRNLQQT